MNNIELNKINSEKRYTVHFILGIFILSLIILLHTIPVMIFGYYVWDDYNFNDKFDSIKIGMNKESVISVLGKPDFIDHTFYLGQEHGFEEEYEKAKQSKSIEYWHWHKGIDVVYTIGFDREGTVTIAESGGT